MNKLFLVMLMAVHLQTCGADKLHDAEVGFTQHWDDFGGNTKDFPLWTPDWKEENLKVKFDQMIADRWSTYFVNAEDFGKEGAWGQWREEYQIPENWESWYSRYPAPGLPTYNLASPDYNASIVILQGIHFLAMEAPCEKNVNVFFQVLDDYKVTDLVRLTQVYEKGRENCFPYWEGRMDIHSVSGRPTLKIASHEMNYFPTDCWENHQGIEPKKLLALVKAVRSTSATDQKIIGVHCRAGAGRTGTFIAAYVLIREIDMQIANGVDVDQLEVNIDKVIWKLSLQRPFAVTHFPQYLALYQLVDHYIKTF